MKVLGAVSLLLLITAVFAVEPTVVVTDSAIIIEPKSLLAKLGGLAWAIFCVVGPILQYYPTIQNVLSLSPYVIAILLISNIIRLFYWAAEPFEIALALQSIVMIGMQIILLNQLTIEYKANREKFPKKTIWSEDFNLDSFWQWTDFQSYQLILSSLVTILVGGYLFLNEHKWYGSLLGYLGLLIEACLGVPQVLKNIKNPQAGQSPFLFVTWLAGDLAKTAAFIATGAPLPFIACGIVQTVTDIVIIGQILFILPKSEKKQE